MQNIEMSNVSEAELQQVEGGSWWGVAGGVALTIALGVSGVGIVGCAAAALVYGAECEMMGA